jgi:D-3-phosphoglycerate dehydrogenase
MFKIQVFNKIAKVGLNQFPTELYEVSPEIQHPDAILVRSHNMHDMKIPDSVKVIGRAGAGVNNIPVHDLTKLGVPVFNTPGANANAVCELVIAGMLIASRHLCTAWDYARHLQGNDAVINETIEGHKKQFVGSELMGKTLGIIGLGSIGVRVANAAIHLGMRVIGYDPTISVSRAWELSSQVQQAHHLEDILKASDFVTVHVPLMESTKNLLNAERLQTMQNHAVLLNFSRDGIVDNKALHAILNAKSLAAYVSDFPCEILMNHPAVINFPHLGASTNEAEENCAVMIVKQIRNYLEYGAIMHSANFPMVEISPNYSGIRLAVVNANVPSMVAQISAKLAEARLNILSLVNKSREEIAYTLLDLGGDVSAETVREIEEIEGILQVRVIGPCLQPPLK